MSCDPSHRREFFCRECGEMTCVACDCSCFDLINRPALIEALKREQSEYVGAEVDGLSIAIDIIESFPHAD